MSSATIFVIGGRLHEVYVGLSCHKSIDKIGGFEILTDTRYLCHSLYESFHRFQLKLNFPTQNDFRYQVLTKK